MSLFVFGIFANNKKASLASHHFAFRTDFFYIYLVHHQIQQITNNKQQLTIKTSGEEGLVEAVKTITYMNEREYQMLRQNCRRHVEENFTIDLMVNDYEVALQRLIDNS